MNNISESRLRDKIEEYLSKTFEDKRELWFLKVLGNGMQKGGVPDFLICYKGVFIGLEVKKPVDSYGLQERQVATIKKIKKAGGISTMVDNLDQVKDILQQIKGTR